MAIVTITITDIDGGINVRRESSNAGELDITLANIAGVTACSLLENEMIVRLMSAENQLNQSNPF